jgi:hypothetical protein
MSGETPTLRGVAAAEHAWFWIGLGLIALGSLILWRAPLLIGWIAAGAGL